MDRYRRAFVLSYTIRGKKFKCFEIDFELC